jgi:DNA-binding response OmpR family regulator
MLDRAPRILLVDDEQSIQTLLSYPLRKDGYEVVQATDGREALARFGESTFDLVVLDVMMPRVDGLEVCRRLRSRSSVPIIMLTAKADEIDKVLGLELGADDYITKPFSIREFRSRIRAVLRRAGLRAERATDGLVEAGVLASHPGRVYSRQALLEAVWGDSAYREPRTIDVHIRHLREKIEPDPREPAYIFTVRGVGYRFRDASP